MHASAHSSCPSLVVPALECVCGDPLMRCGWIVPPEDDTQMRMMFLVRVLRCDGRRGKGRAMRRRVRCLPSVAQVRTGAGVPRAGHSCGRPGPAASHLRSRLAVRLPRIPPLVPAPTHPAAPRGRREIWEHCDYRAVHSLHEDRGHPAHGPSDTASRYAAGTGAAGGVARHPSKCPAETRWTATPRSARTASRTPTPPRWSPDRSDVPPWTPVAAVFRSLWETDYTSNAKLLS